MKILIVDDHPIYRKDVIALLHQMEPMFYERSAEAEE
jgi:DNA-binding NarL/FixJ family response regulator